MLSRPPVSIRIAAIILLLPAIPALAQDQVGNPGAQANNPLANMTALSMQDYYIGELTESDDSANQFWFRYAKPFSLGDTDWLLRAAPIRVYNLENDDYNVPMGIGLGKVMKRGTTVYNLFVEPQFSIADDGPGQPDWQIFMGLSQQFLN